MGDLPIPDAETLYRSRLKVAHELVDEVTQQMAEEPALPGITVGAMAGRPRSWWPCPIGRAGSALAQLLADLDARSPLEAAKLAARSNWRPVAEIEDEIRAGRGRRRLSGR